MAGRIGYSKKLEELVKAKKADDSILETINTNKQAYADAKKELKKVSKNIEKLEQDIVQKRKEKYKIAIYRVKDFSQLFKEINSLKKEIKKREDEKTYLEEFCNEKQELNSKIEKDITSQYAIYQVNEMYIKAVEKVEQTTTDLAADFYLRYINHTNKYLNSMYSLQNDTKLEEPNAKDLAILLNILERNEKAQKENEKKLKAQEVSTKKKATSTTKKTENKKSTTTRAKKTSKVIDIKSKETIDEKPKKQTRKSSKKDVVNQ